MSGAHGGMATANAEVLPHMRIDADTRLNCLIGKPARHSLSPVMHNAAFEALEMNKVYLAFEPENLKKAMEALKELGVKGFNITMPFKVEVMKYLDRVDLMAKKIGAVNTVVEEKGLLVGYNTDGIGAIESLKKAFRGNLKGKKVLLLGAGGAGRAIAFHLKEEKADVMIADRNALKAIRLAKALGMKSIPLQSLKSLDGFGIIINASPAGMKPKTRETPVPAKLLMEELIVFDIVYEPPETRLLREAKKAGCTTINGLEMLLNQGFETFRLFTGVKAPEEVMREAVMKAVEL